MASSTTPDDRRHTAAYTVADFCAAYSISRPFLYRLWSEGRGPRSVKLGRRVLIRAEDAENWLRNLAETGGER